MILQSTIKLRNLLIIILVLKLIEKSFENYLKKLNSNK